MDRATKRAFKLAQTRPRRFTCGQHSRRSLCQSRMGTLDRRRQSIADALRPCRYPPAQADAEVAALHIHELPTARGCTYVLGEHDYIWALSLGQGPAKATVKVLDKLGVERSEVNALAERALKLLQNAQGPLGPKQLKDQLGNAVRSLGEEGKKKGASTTLPTVLGLLQAGGRI